MVHTLQYAGNRLMKRSANRLFIMPHILLQPYIAHYTIMFSHGGAGAEPLTLIPDASGCVVYFFDGNTLDNRFWGPMTKVARVNEETPDASFWFFIEFLPCGAYHFSGIPQSEFMDLQTPLENIDNAMAKNIEEAMECSRTVQELADLLDDVFLSRLYRMNFSPNEEKMVSMIKQVDSACTVKHLSTEIHYSERHINRVFQKVLGMNAKKYLRLLRINRIISQVECLDRPLTFLAQEAGYYDQAHFNHDFKAVCGVAPTVYRENLSGFYNEKFKF